MKTVDISKLKPRKLRNPLFNRRTCSKTGFNYSDKWDDNIPEQIEKLDGFDGWENFNVTWDVLWVGLDPRNLVWIEGRHNSPDRKLITPIRLVKKDKSSGRMLVSAEDRVEIQKLKVPYKKPLPESDSDRRISDMLSNKTSKEIEDYKSPVVDEGINDLEAQMKEMIQKMQEIKSTQGPK